MITSNKNNTYTDVVPGEWCEIQYGLENEESEEVVPYITQVVEGETQKVFIKDFLSVEHESFQLENEIVTVQGFSGFTNTMGVGLELSKDNDQARLIWLNY